MTDRTLRVATLNIWNRTGPWEERLRVIRAGLQELAPDLIGLQEVIKLAPDFGDGLDQAAVIAHGLGYEVGYGRARDELFLGNAALSRWPIAKSHTYDLPRLGTDERRTLLFVEVRSPWGPLRFFVTHLNWKFEEGHVREAQVRDIAARVEAVMHGVSPTEPPAILVGDFNAEPDADEVRYLRGLTSLGGSKRVYYQDAFALAGDGSAGATFSRKNPFAAPLHEPDRRIDYIFVHGRDESGRGEVVEARVCFDTPLGGTFASDHFGVVATMRL
jgi:endonuclease/exonuclease/phosphatase family metal-dependent hydrolase